MTAKTRNRDWLLDNLIERLPNADFAVVLSTDGLLLGRCSAMAQSDAERFAAIGSTLHAVARGDGTHFDVGGYTRPLWTGSGDVVHRRWRQHLFGPLIGETANMGTVAYEMNQTGQRVGAHLSVDPRPKILDDTGSRRP